MLCEKGATIMPGSNLIEQLIQKKISKRDFLKIAGISVFCYVVGVPLLDETKGIVTKEIHEIMQPIDSLNLDLVYKIFGKLNSNHKFIPGTSHFLHIGKIHPDDKYACSVLEKAGIAGISNLEIIHGLYTPDDLDGNLVCLGSPMSNFLSKEILQYEANGLKENGLKRKKEKLLFDLPFEYVFDIDILTKNSMPTNRLVGQNEVKIPNWSLYDRANDKYLIPRVNENNNLQDDYLLITVLPNCLSKASYEKEDKIIIFGGTHGVGTMAIDPLFKHKQLLTSLHEKTKNIKYWQALIRATNIGIHKESKRSHPYDISPEIDVRSLNLLTANVERFTKGNIS
jgi:hypothetical protein